MSQIINAAKSYSSANISVFPVKENKKPYGSWEKAKNEILTHYAIEKEFYQKEGLAVICGKVSGNLEAIDIDCKYDLTGTLFEDYKTVIQDNAGDVWERLVIAQTQNGGYHLIYRCSEISGNKKLAERHLTAEEQEEDNAKQIADGKALKKNAKRVLIETRGEGGYIIAAPTNGYKIIQGSLSDVKNITPLERSIIFEAAALFSTVDIKTEEETQLVKATESKNTKKSYTVKKQEHANTLEWCRAKVEEFNTNNNALDIILNFAYERGSAFDNKRGKSKIHLCNTSTGDTNGSYYPDDNLVYLFSDSYNGLPSNVPLRPFDLVLHLEYKGNKKAFFSALGAEERKNNPIHSRENKKPIIAKKAAILPEEQYEEYEEVRVNIFEDNIYFKLLGFNKSGERGKPYYFFLRKDNSTLYALTAAEMTAKNLLTCAPLDFWAGWFPVKKDTDFDTVQATDFIIQACNEIGFFNPSRIRGRGTWIEEDSKNPDIKKIVIHTGTKLIVNGKETQLGTYKSKFIYELQEDLELDPSMPLSTEEAGQLLDLCKTVSWSRPNDGILFAGWCVIAPFGGALEWRPHIWISGESSSGKSTVCYTILKPLIGTMGLNVQGKTTEAAIRQSLQMDSIAVYFDEADTDSKEDKQRIQDVISLARSGNDQDAPAVIKGGQDGGVKTYNVKSCFAFSSVVFQPATQADYRRFTSLETKVISDKNKAQAYVKTIKEKSKIITKGFCKRFRNRTINMLPIILENIQAFKDALFEEMENQGALNQLAPMLAGAYSLTNDEAATVEQAKAFIKGLDWGREAENFRSTDKSDIISEILNARVKGAANENLLIGELVLNASAQVNTDRASREAANAELKRNGLGVGVRSNVEYLFIANKHPRVKALLNTKENGGKFRDNYEKLLSRIDGAIAGVPYKFIPENKRSTMIPLNNIVDIEPETDTEEDEQN